jgi:hypothetical protein
VFSVPVDKNNAQGYGSALTYARRYSLSAAFGVAPEDDDGNAAAKASPAQRIIAANVTPTAGLMEQLEKGQQEIVRALGDEVIDCFEAGAPEVGYGLIAQAGLDTDEKAALWTLFDSKMRSALKKIGESKKPQVSHLVEPREKDIARAEAKGTA